MFKVFIEAVFLTVGLRLLPSESRSLWISLIMKRNWNPSNDLPVRGPRDTEHLTYLY